MAAESRTSKIIRGLMLVIAPWLLTGCVTASQQDSVHGTYDILFAGDTSHGESYHAQYEADGKGNIIKEKGYDYSFAKLKPILESADYTIVNVETPLTGLRAPPFPVKGYNHWSDPEPATASYVRHGFDAVSLANNHTVDFGVKGLTETLAALDKAGIDYFGAGNSKSEADAPLRKSFSIGKCIIDMVVFGRFEFRQSYQDKYAFYAGEDNAGASAFVLDELIAEIKKEKAENPNSFVVIYPHWGANYKWRLKIQEQQAKAIAAAGADLILGHGAHTMGEVSKIDDTTIVYSLGNFVFNTWGRFPNYPDVLPMSLVSIVSTRVSDSGPVASLKLYPIYSDNRVVSYQPRFVTESEFQQSANALKERGAGEDILAKSRDDIGYFFETDLQSLKCRSSE